jgi:crotonobetaine/carnitine-CoA ligase
VERGAFPETIPELLAWRAARDGARVWLRFQGESLSVSDVLEASGRYAVGLAERGVGRGDRVAILAGNAPEHLFAWFGANLLGAIACPLHTASKPAEIARHVQHMTPRVLVGAGAGAGAGATTIVDAKDLARSRGAPPSVAVSPDDVCVLLGTSGTTGAPKAVMQTHRAYTMTAEAFPAWLGLGASDRLLAMLPLSHINAQAYSTMGSLGCGGELLLVPKFSASRFLSDARRLGATQFNAVGAIIHILLKSEARPDDRDSPLRVAYTALALPEAQHRAFEERFGLSMRVGYGMSETTFGTVWPDGQPPRYGTMGTLRQHPRLGAVSEARVVRDDGSACGDDEPGELHLRSPATMRGYWNDAPTTEATLAGGWLHTGDVVRRDTDGWFTFVGRRKEMLRRRGENISAAEIEQTLLSHPSVKEAAVIGVPSDLGEDDVVAFVAPAPGATLDPDALRAFLRERLADFKVPTRIEVRDALPHTATERIAKHLLR